MNVATLFSGGKDSTYALYIAQQRGWTVTHLVSVFPREFSMLFHYPNIRITKLLSYALGIPLVTAVSKKGEEEELYALKDVLRKTGNIEGVITGAIWSDYQWSRINEICEELGLKTFSPLWRRDSEMLLREMLDAGFDMIIVGAYADGLDSSWLGRKLDAKMLEELIKLRKKRGISLSGEGGEFETLVLDAPNFKKGIRIEHSKTEWRKDGGALIIEKASLVDK